MAKQNVVLELTAAEWKLFQAFQAARMEVDRLGMSLSTVAGRANQVGQTSQRGLGSIAQQAAAVAAGFLGVGSALQALRTVIGVLRNELQAATEFKKTAATRGVEFNEAMRKISWQIPTLDPQAMDIPKETVLEWTRQRIMESRAPNKSMLAGGVLASISAAVGVPYSERVYAGIKLAEGREELLTGDAVTAAMAASQTAMQAYGISFEKAISMLAAAQSTSYITDPQKYYSSIGMAIAGGQGFNMDLQTTLGLFSAIGTRMADPTGELTTTGLINYGRDMYTAAGKMDPKLLNKDFREMEKAVRGEATVRKGLTGILDMSLREEKDVRAELLQMETGAGLDPHMRVRAKGIIPATELAQGPQFWTKTRELFESSMRAIPTPETAEGFYEERLKDTKQQLGDLPLQMHYAVERAKDVAQFGIGTEAQQMAGVYLKMLEGAATEFGVDTATGAWLREKAAQIKTISWASPEQVLRDAVGWAQERESEIRQREWSQGQDYGAFRATGGGPGGRQRIRTLSEYEQRQVEWLQLLQEEFKKIAENLKAAQERPRPVIITGDSTRIAPAEPAQTPQAALNQQ